MKGKMLLPQVGVAASARRGALFFRFYGQSEIGPVSGHWYTRRSAARSTGQCVGWPLLGFVSTAALAKFLMRGEVIE